MGFDSRVGKAMLSLGYRIFPFEAFDESGRLVVPGVVDFPADVDIQLGRIASNPLWGDLYRTLSGRRDELFMAGVGFMNDRIQVALVKSTASVRHDQQTAMNWADGYHGTTEATLHAYAGRTYAIDPAWRPALEKARGMLPASQQDVEVGNPFWEFRDASDNSAAPASYEPMQTVSVPFFRLGLDFLVDLVATATFRTKVLSTVVWYPPQPVDVNWPWKPLHANLQRGWFSGHRSAHLVWNPIGTPVVIYGKDLPWRGPGLDMPHDPFQWCQALRPLANCLGRRVEITAVGTATEA